MHPQAEFQATQIKGLEEYRDSVANDQQRKQVDDCLTRMREQVDAWVAQKQELTGIVSEQEAEFRAEQAKMERFEDELVQVEIGAGRWLKNQRGWRELRTKSRRVVTLGP